MSLDDWQWLFASTVGLFDGWWLYSNIWEMHLKASLPWVPLGGLPSCRHNLWLWRNQFASAPSASASALYMGVFHQMGPPANQKDFKICGVAVCSLFTA
jgi:hypothetical protein